MRTCVIIILIAFHHGTIISSPDVHKVSGTQSECDALEHQFSDLRRTSLKQEQLQSLLESFEGDILHGYMANGIEDALHGLQKLVCNNKNGELCIDNLSERVAVLRDLNSWVPNKSESDARAERRPSRRSRRSTRPEKFKPITINGIVHYQECAGGKERPEDIGIPADQIVTTDPDTGAITTIECCHEDGAFLQPFHRRLCTTCDATTHFETGEYWPEFLNEALCAGTEAHQCLNLEGVWQGDCSENTVTLQLLRKNSDLCSLVVVDNEVIITEDWVVTYWDWRAGCQCYIIMGSQLDQLLSFTHTPGEE